MRKKIISKRKDEHLELALHPSAGYSSKTTGFEHWEFLHNALPELDFNEIDTTTMFLGKRLSFPFMVCAMTGGSQKGKRVNTMLAEVCKEKGIALSVGSQRQALENMKHHDSYRVVRSAADAVPVIGNIGAAEIANLNDCKTILNLIDLIGASAFAVHLNPAQELFQLEGTPHFKGVLAGIEFLVKHLSVPVLVKEVGSGLSQSVARQLCEAGVQYLDVAGAGGTSWTAIEIERHKRKRKQIHLQGEVLHELFGNWGIPTAECIQEIVPLKRDFSRLILIASGGVYTGLDIAKALALGADLTGAARLILQTLEEGGKKKLHLILDSLLFELRSTMFLTGSRTIADLKRQQLREVP